MKTRTFGLAACVLLLYTGQVPADEIRVAAASNFAAPMKKIAARFEARTGHTVTLAFGSTGKHYAQIRNGAPFEVFFAADVERPALLEKKGVAVKGSRFAYAVGKVVLWSPEKGVVDANGEVLNEGDFRHLALANPRLAPYGKAAEQVMRRRGVWDKLQDRLVRGENISQALQFVSTGNAELGFVAYSQIKSPDNPMEGSWWVPPQSLYDPIEQQAILLKDNQVARAFLRFVKSDEAVHIIREYGYDTP